MSDARRIDAAIASRKQAGPECERRVVEALARLSARRQPITLLAVLEESGVSKSFIYTRPQLRKEIPSTGGGRRNTAGNRTRDYDRPRVASLETRVSQLNGDLLRARSQLRDTERALVAAGATDVLLASNSEGDELKAQIARLSVDLIAARDRAARLESLLADKEAAYQAARENARDYLKELMLLRGERTEASSALGAGGRRSR